MEKKAFIGRNIDKLVQYGNTNRHGIQAVGSAVGTAAKGLGILAAGSYALSKIKTKIQNEPRRKAIVEDLASNDPIIKEADKDQVLQYYATIYNIAPTVSLDKNAVREILQGFVRFGRVDVQTLKTLAETERLIHQSKDKGLAMGGLF